ncbi:MAG: nucleotidyltransferase family protein [Bacteroidia bacterium]|nr:nucleotidyltransferase family protein [Bacteroidia bacterium]
MKAMIFAAGLGTRLKPLTDAKPKALIEINGIPLLEIVINKLISYGFNKIIINVHHFPYHIIDFLKKKKNFNIHIEISDESGQLLDTGGGLRKACWFLQDKHPVLIHNVDVFSDIDLTNLYEAHINSGALATLAVRSRRSSRYFLFDEDLTLCGWENVKTGDREITKFTGAELTPMAFSGIQILSPAFFDNITENGVFSIVATYLRLSANHKIHAYIHDNSFWLDLGKPENLKKAEAYLK